MNLPALRVLDKTRPPNDRSLRMPFTNCLDPYVIHLESAAVVFHMTGRIWRIDQIIASRVFLGPEAGLWLAPFSQQKRRPKHAGVSTRFRPAPGRHAGAPLAFTWKEPTF